jgi:hypothetical protein
MRLPLTRTYLHLMILVVAFIATAAAYWPGLKGDFLFDDYPNIVDNQAVQPHDARWSSLVGAALSSPSSEFKRPLASLSFAANYLATGLDPYWMKLTNLFIHLLNGLLVFLLSRALLQITSKDQSPRASTVAALIAASWMLLPINLTAVLYIVQRMESMANAFVLLGLIGYVTGRQRMLAAAHIMPSSSDRRTWKWFWLCAASITVPTIVGALAKETAVMLPVYALAIEWVLFDFGTSPAAQGLNEDFTEAKHKRKDRRIVGLYVLVLLVPLVIGLIWLLPSVLQPERWSTRNFTLGTRLLTEPRVIADYAIWSMLPTPHALSFYHDDFQVSADLLTPWTTLTSIAWLASMLGLVWWLRSRQPLTALGIAMFLSCQMLTGTILPLELIYEHRNYFASFGILLVILPLLAAPKASRFALSRHLLLAGLMVCWTSLTALTAYAWGNPLRLAQDLADRAPRSPRAQYELGRIYIIASHYDPASPFTQLAYTPLEKAASLPGSSILPEQALIFMNARMHLPLKDAWWDSIVAKLKAHPPGVQDESSLGSLTECARDKKCTLPTNRMMQAFMAALSHPNPSARLLSMYGDYAWNVLNDHPLGERMGEEAVKASPNEPAYRITLIRMLIVMGRETDARDEIRELQRLNIGGRLDDDLAKLRPLFTSQN